MELKNFTIHYEKQPICLWFLSYDIDFHPFWLMFLETDHM